MVENLRPWRHPAWRPGSRYLASPTSSIAMPAPTRIPPDSLPLPLCFPNPRSRHTKPASEHMQILCIFRRPLELSYRGAMGDPKMRRLEGCQESR